MRKTGRRAARGQRAAAPEPEPRQIATRMFAMAVPGLAPLIAREIEELPGAAAHDVGFDGRSDVVLFDVGRGPRAGRMKLDLAEDVFVEVGRTLRSSGDNPRWIAERIWRPERVRRALSVWAERSSLRSAMTFRVVVRVLQERSFLRTDLRREMTRLIQTDRPGWQVADPARMEVWICEYRPGRFVAGLRLSDVRMRQHDGRTAQRQGALRPTVAAAMVRLAGDPEGLLVDPCCGSGTILAEAHAAGWKPWGADIDPEAVRIARRNVGAAEIQVGDARGIDLPDGAAGAVVSNLPFGRQFAVQGDETTWHHAVLGEMARVTRPGGRVVVLAPRIPRSAVPHGLRLMDQFKIRILGRQTTIWIFESLNSLRPARRRSGVDGGDAAA